MAFNLQSHGTVDAQNIKSLTKENKKWREIFYRLLDIKLFHRKQNLAFRAQREDSSSIKKRNFPGAVELLSNYDPVLKEHFAKQRERKTQEFISYISLEI